MISSRAQIAADRLRSRVSIRSLAVTVSAALLLSGLGLSAPAGAAVGTPSGRVDLKVLVLDDGTPGVAALVTQMDREGIPFDVRPESTPVTAATATADGLLEAATSGAPRAFYQAVVLSHSSPAGLDASEIATLAAFERKYAVRQVDAYLFPTAANGLVNQWSGPLDGMTATLTSTALAGSFGYLDGPVTIEDADATVAETYGFLALPSSPQAPRVTYDSMLTMTIPGTSTQGSLIGVRTDQGREEMIISGAFNGNQSWFQTIGHGILDWATRGVHLGYQRSYFSVHVDDVFLPDSRWSDVSKCTPGDDFCPSTTTTTDIRMTAADVARLTSWQATNGFTTDLLFNGGGSEAYKVEQNVTSDPLVAAFTAPGVAPAFRWTNHTYSHPFLGCIQIAPTRAGESWHCATSATETPRQDPTLTGQDVDGVQWLDTISLRQQVRANIDWANLNGLSGLFNPTELVTGEHSGLRVGTVQPIDNPLLGPALTAEGIAVTGSDNSRESSSRLVQGGTTTTLPRYPMNIFYNAGTYADEVSEYNWIYTSAADGGGGSCEANPATSTCITPLTNGSAAQAQASFTSYLAPLEVRIASSHVLTNDPRPHYAHQSNIAEDGILYPVLEGVLANYRSAFADNAPLVTPTMTESSAVLARSTLWSGARSSVTAYLDSEGVHVPDAGAAAVPVTVPTGTTGFSGLTAYAGELSGWVGGARTLVVPRTGYSTPATPAAPSNVRATAGNSSVELTWTAPTQGPNGAPVSSYVVTPYAAGVAQGPISTTDTATALTVTSLANGTAYTFTVAARSANGTSPASAPSVAATPATTPGTPTGLSAHRADRRVSLTWTAPADNGSALLGYVVATTAAGETVPPVTVGAGATAATVTGLTNGITYSFTVTATNGVGSGSPSAPVTATPIVGLSAAMRTMPSSLTLSPTVTYSWRLQPAGSVASGYDVYVRRAGFGRPLPSTWTLLRRVTTTSTTIRFSPGGTIVVAVRPVDPTGEPALLSAPTRPVTYVFTIFSAFTSLGWSTTIETPAPHVQLRKVTPHSTVVRLPKAVQAMRYAVVVGSRGDLSTVEISVGGHVVFTRTVAKGNGKDRRILVSGWGVQRTGRVVVRVRSTGHPVTVRSAAVLR